MENNNTTQEDTETLKPTEPKNGLISKSIVIAGLLVALAIALPKFNSENTQVATSVEAVERGSLLINPVDDEDHKRGAENPKITLVEFSDFGCHFCGVLHPNLISLVEEYPDQIQWVYRQLPFRDLNGALAGECVASLAGNDSFWDFTDVMFSNRTLITDEFTKKTAMSFGISSSEFDSCLVSEETIAKIQKDDVEATLLDIRATPYTVLITDTGREVPLKGALPKERLDSIIKSLL
jgi:predicted DsbA family dithiol-disulfide isomerase